MSRKTHVVIPTHTTRHLHRTLLGYATQDQSPTTITVSCDTDDPGIGDLLEQVVAKTGLTITHVQRARHPEARLAQTRNNGIRSLLKRGLEDEDLLIFVDGDCIPAVDFVACHDRASRDRDFVIGNYILLDEQVTADIPSDETMRSHLEGLPNDEQMQSMRRLESKARKHQLLRTFGLTKAHKPKILGANTSVRAGNVLAINGYDENYLEWGFEDDDFGRRLYRSGAKSRIAITEAIMLHQWHPTRKGRSWESGSVAQRFKSRLPTRCTNGIENPLEQHELHERTLSP
ncbi:MAG: galactosyltransferase-related protein [Phycisphaerales bacterium]|nr:galactosyltransferase-related protein [Phycisphaerales bacterium]